jgi:hypothetical protein
MVLILGVCHWGRHIERSSKTSQRFAWTFKLHVIRLLTTKALWEVERPCVEQLHENDIDCKV